MQRNMGFIYRKILEYPMIQISEGMGVLEFEKKAFKIISQALSTD